MTPPKFPQVEKQGETIYIIMTGMPMSTGTIDGAFGNYLELEEKQALALFNNLREALFGPERNWHDAA